MRFLTGTLVLLVAAGWLLLTPSSRQVLAAFSLGTGRRLVATSGTLTEIIFALGFGSEVVAVDVTARWPESVRSLPSIGHAHQLSPKVLQGVAPTLVLTHQGAGPPAAFEPLRTAGIAIQFSPADPDRGPLEGLREEVHFVAEALGCSYKGHALIQAMDADLVFLRSLPVPSSPPRGLFLLGENPAHLHTAGHGSMADDMLQWLGVHNVAHDVHGLKVVPPDAFIQLAPELLFLSGPPGGAPPEVPGLDRTPAGRSGRIETVDSRVWVSGGIWTIPELFRMARRLHPHLDIPRSRTGAWLERVAGGS